MTFVKRVIIYGDSIFLGGVAETLRADPGLTVVSIRTPDSKMQLEDSRPDVVVVDALQTSLDQVNALMLSFHSRPGLPFISLNATAKQLTVLSSRQYPAINVPDLMQVIKNFV